MSPTATNASSLVRIAVALLIASTVVMWLPALNTPFWGDDYVFLHAAQASNASGATWWSDFWPASPPRFWRPLSQEGYWRLVAGVLHADAYWSHVLNLVLHVLAAGSVALLGLSIARACRWPHAGGIAGLSGALYGALGMHLLPVHWVAAANNSMLVIFTALALSAWVAAAKATPVRRALLLTSLPLLLAAGLLSKESAALTPLLMAVVWLFVGNTRASKAEIATWLICVATVLVWLVLRQRFTANTDASYEFRLGGNLIRNAASLLAWLLNVPREALRMALTGESMRGFGWIAATSLPILLAWIIALRSGRSLLTRRQWFAVPVFCVLAYAPYFFFAWNSYEYYAAIAAILLVIVMARGLVGSRGVVIAVTLVALSSWIGVAGTRSLEHPGLIGRARWAEDVLQQLQKQSIKAPLWVQVEDDQRFYAIGQAGLAWRLGIEPQDIHVVDQCPGDTRQCIVIDKQGNWRWQQKEVTGKTD